MMSELLAVGVAVLAYVSIVFVIAMRAQRLDIVDIAWGGAFIVAAYTSFLLGESQGALQVLVTLLVTVWGVRLALSIWSRYRASSKEDPRYTELRAKWKGNVLLNAYFRIFIVQGFLALVVSASVIVVNLAADSSLSWLAAIGAAVWAFGFYFESVGDAQLKKHLANPGNKGKLMTSGLWRYTRHPNYFGEATQWWGIWIIALGVPYGWATVIAPLTITVLLLYVSGVPLTEKRFVGRPGWDAYKARTSVFVPLPPRR